MALHSHWESVDEVCSIQPIRALARQVNSLCNWGALSPAAQGVRQEVSVR
jgi:hypothetical protein